MRIQKPTITSVTVLSGDGASLTGSFSGSFIGWEGIDGKPDPLLSSSAQIASDISGSFTLVSASIAADIANLDNNYATDVELLAATSSLSASLAVDISTKADKTAVSGAFTTTSASIATDIANLDSTKADKTAITGAFTTTSASIATDIATNLSSINTLNSKTLVSGSAQIASNISGSFVQASSSIASDIDTIQANISSNDTDISGLNSYTSSLKTAITVSGANTTILGNLTVQGTQTQLQTATLNVEDLNITVASGSATAAAANGAGLTVAGAGATLTYASTGDKWEVNKPLNVPVNGIQINGTAVTATAAELNILDGADTDLNTLSVPANTTISTFGASLVDDADAGTARTTLGLGGLATLSAVGASEITDNSVGAAELNVAGNGTSTQFLRSDGDGTFSWAVPTDTNTTYSAGSGIGLTGTTFSVAAGGGLTQDASGLSHTDTSTQASVSNTGRTYIQSITLDTYGHITAISSGTETVTDTNTTYSAGTNLNLSGTTFSIPTSTDFQIDSLGVGTAAPGTTGVIRATNDIVAYYSSDERLKDNIKPLEGALDKVNAMGGYEFDWNDNQEVHEGHDIGVIAQEVQAQYPELVHERDNGYLAVDYVKLTAVLLQAVKELSAKVDQLSK